MSKIDQIKDQYLRQAQKLLSGHEEDLRTFEALWVAGKLREAYVFLSEAAKRLQLEQSEEDPKADENFFWTYMH